MHDREQLKPLCGPPVPVMLMRGGGGFPAYSSCASLPRHPLGAAPARPAPARETDLLDALALGHCVPVPASSTPAHEGSSGRNPPARHETNHVSLPIEWPPPGCPALAPPVPAPLP